VPPSSLLTQPVLPHPSQRPLRFAEVPPNWGAQWLAGLRRISDGGLARISALMDSLGTGETADNWLINGWVGIERALLQSRLGDGGSGVVTPTWRSSGNPGGGQVTSTGAWTDVDGEGGFGGKWVRPTAAGNGATMTFPARGEIIDIFTKTDPSFGRLDYRIDGGALVQIPLNSAVSNKTTTVTGLAATDHTVVVTAAAGTSRLAGVRGRNPAGLILDNPAWSGRTITQLSIATTGLPATGVAAQDMVGDTLTGLGPADLVILSLGGADVILDPGVSHEQQDAIWASLEVAGNRILNAGPSTAEPPDLLVVIENVGTADILAGFSQFARDWNQISSTIRTWARSMGAAIVDMYADGRRSWQYWRDLGYWGGGVGGAAGNDGIHLSNAGHREYQQRVHDVLAW
jgi:lysophospholipase L1-like esterase